MPTDKSGNVVSWDSPEGRDLVERLNLPAKRNRSDREFGEFIRSEQDARADEFVPVDESGRVRSWDEFTGEPTNQWQI